MKKILIVIHDMKIGGAQKSLLSFLKCLMASQWGKEYEIHLMLAYPHGEFLSQIPQRVKLVAPSKPLYWMSSHVDADLLLKHFSWRGLYGEVCWILRKLLNLFPDGLNNSQKMWECWKNLIPEDSEQYDVAISYIDGCTNYYLMEKVNAQKKVLWFHSEYQKHGYCPEYDSIFLEKCDCIVTVSDKCRTCLLEAFPHMDSKMHILENITVYEDLVARSGAAECTEFADVSVLKLLTVGRLHPLKGIDLAVEAAKQLKSTGIPFCWLVVGDGPEREHIQRRIEAAGVSECFHLIGSRENPYPYMAQCDIVVQPSRVEGKSIVLDEAKMLLKPIVVTAYATVKDSVDHGNSGWIVEMTGQSICDGIVHLWQDKALRSHISTYLQKLSKGNEEELNRYMEIMFR